jgi:predicted transcriptional regulator
MIGDGDIKTAISEMKNILQESRLLDEMIIQSARYNDLMQKIRTGMITSEEEEVMKNKLRYSLQEMLHVMEENFETHPELVKEVDKVLEKGKNILTNSSSIGNNSSGNIVIQGTGTEVGNITIGK